ncbi:MAG: DsbE family thiol:disulfide interchange protein [Burkholderiaceae bacterium]|jgi:cytochrome c biogenesis protein CcmG/thiol:disulfide interchange protein DsbE|nr:DsbE family thiol:disulfide interchange protein [Burkholderiaceae bacterium]
MTVLTRLRRHWALSLALAAALALLLLLAVGLTRDPRLLPSVMIGKPWPNIALPQLGDANGGAIGPAQLRGKARLVNVWASWCAVCSDEQPVLLALGETLREQGRADQLIGLNYKDKPSDALAWLQRYGAPFAAVLVDADGRMGIELGVYGAPESYLIDAQGTIVWKHVGELTPDLIARQVLPRLGVQP